MHNTNLEKAPSPLKLKVGDGGLDQSIIDKAQARADAIEIPFEEIIPESILKLQQYSKAEALIVANDLDDFLFHLVPLKAETMMTPYQSLQQISKELLEFVEALTTVNVDAHHIIRAHIKAMEAVFKHKISDTNTRAAKVLLNELDDSRTRFRKKYAA